MTAKSTAKNQSGRIRTFLSDPEFSSRLWTRVFDEISFRENFAKLATKRFSCFAKMRDEFREFQFREAAHITKETNNAKHENRENKENLK
jgi:hypothetical protein